jgi:predicted enzyme related to lactoylglutathione lyase
MTSDTKAATAFLQHVISWQAQEHAMPDNRIYTVFSKGPAMVAELMGIPEASCAEGVKPCWSGYIATDDVDADVARVAAAGGTIRRLPEDIPNVGRFAVAADPEGAVFLLCTLHCGISIQSKSAWGLGVCLCYIGTAGISSKVPPWKLRPVRSLRAPPHCLKKNAVLAARHAIWISSTHDRCIGRARGPLSPPTMAHSMPVRSTPPTEPRSGSNDTK